MSITKQDIDQLEDWLDTLYWAEKSDIDNSDIVTPSYYPRAYKSLDEERAKMLALIDKLRDHFGVE